MKKIAFNQKKDLAEKALTVFYFIYYSGAIFPLFITQGASEGEGVDLATFNWTLFNYGFIFSYFIGALSLIFRWRRTLFLVKRGGLFLSLVTLMVPASIVWSISPDDTFTASIGLIGTTLFGLYVAARFSLKEQVKLLGIAFGILIITGFLLAVGLPKYGIMGGVHAGTFRGAFTHKNVIGKYMVLSLAVFLSMPKNSKWVWAGIAGSVLSIILCNSTSALVNGTLVTIIFVFLNKFLILRPKLFALSTSVSILAAWGASEAWKGVSDQVFSFLGKDPTLTGRTDIWAFVLKSIENRPLLGYGFNAFWGNLRVREMVTKVFQWDVPDAHNGYLDFILNLGIIGFVLYFLCNLELIKKAFSIARKDFTPDILWPFLLTIYILSINFAETTLISHNSIVWLLFVILCFTVPIELYHLNYRRQAVREKESVSRENALRC